MESGHSSSESEDEEKEGPTKFTTNMAEINYEGAGSVVGVESDEIKLINHPNLLSDKVHLALQEILALIKLPFELADFQKLSLHVLGSGENLILLSPTGSGKMLIVWLGSLLMRSIFNNPVGVSIGTQPLSLIMEDKLIRSLVPTGVISMAGDMRHNLEAQEDVIYSHPEENFLSGNLPVIIGHPESWGSVKGQQLARKLNQRSMIVLEFIDEFHQSLPNHWNNIRPEMMQIAGQLRIFAERGAPTVAMSATATDEEVQKIIATLGLRRPPVILRASPVQIHTKYCVVRRPPNIYGPYGREDKNGQVKPGLLELLETVYLNKYVSCIKSGLPVKQAIIFCKSDKHVIEVYEHVKEKLPKIKVSESPFVMNHAGVGKATAQSILDRRNEISLYISTTKMLMGVDLDRIDIIIFIRPLNMLHYLIQGAGRAGRRTVNGRRSVLVYVLVNSSDIATNVPGMTDSVRHFCTTKECLKENLEKYFNSEVATKRKLGWCCSNCDLK